MKKTTNKRTLQITCAQGEEITPKMLSCFVYNLNEDVRKENPIIKWAADLSFDDGLDAFYTNGLAVGTLIQLRMVVFDGKQGVQLIHKRNGKQLFCAVEFQGDTGNYDHLAALYHNVSMVVTKATLTKKPENKESLSSRVGVAAPEPEQYCLKVGDVFRKITDVQMIDYILKHPTILSIGIIEGSPEWFRLESLIRATVTYIQNVAPKETGILMSGFSLKHLSDGRRCGNLVTEPMSRIANAFVKIREDKYYADLKPAEANLKFAADIVINLLAGV